MWDFVKQINYGYPAEIVCENDTYKLRRKKVQKSFKGSSTVKTVLSYLLEGTGIKISGKVPTIGLENYVIQSCDSAFALQKLKDDFDCEN